METLLKAKEVGQMLGLSKRQIFRHRDSGKIPAPVQVGGSIRWIESELNRWVLAGAPGRAKWEEMKRSVAACR